MKSETFACRCCWLRSRQKLFIVLRHQRKQQQQHCCVWIKQQHTTRGKLWNFKSDERFSRPILPATPTTRTIIVAQYLMASAEFPITVTQYSRSPRAPKKPAFVTASWHRYKTRPRPPIPRFFYPAPFRFQFFLWYPKHIQQRWRELAPKQIETVLEKKQRNNNKKKRMKNEEKPQSRDRGIG